MNRRRLFYYILLNIFVSAAVTGTILFFYDRGRSNPPVNAVVPTLDGLSAASPLAADVKANIVSVIGAGQVGSEIVVIQNDGNSQLVLSGWRLKNSQGNTYTFPQLVTLYPGGTVQVHTGTGEDTAVDLYWGRSSPAWTPGELAALYDTSGVARAFYRIP